ncbi:MAG: DUF4419 domain-containing protein [Bacteroidales bacterium]|nr:DUF4419 domain-containing protein [Candidatus Colicola faecequi]
MKRLIYIIALLLPMAFLCGCRKAADDFWPDVQRTHIHLADLPEPEAALPKNTSSYFLMDLENGQNTLAHSEMTEMLVPTQHALIDAVRLAYATHRPLVLSPDIVWLVIERGFAKHVDLHADSLRSMFVSFEGKETLEVESWHPLWLMTSHDWEKCVSGFPRQIAGYTGEEIVETLHCDFSTTTPTSLAASDIMIMSTMQSYFEYVVTYWCGIPDIYLEGTPDDWQRILEKTRVLRKYGLDWWIDELEPVLEKIAAASAGERDIVFWQSILQQTDEQELFEVDCGEIVSAGKLNGWIQVFYPYLYGSPRIFDCIYEAEIKGLPSALGSAPLAFLYPNGKKVDLHVYAGLAGIAEDEKTHALRPEICWLISEEGVSNWKLIPYLWRAIKGEPTMEDDAVVKYGAPAAGEQIDEDWYEIPEES